MTLFGATNKQAWSNPRSALSVFSWAEYFGFSCSLRSRPDHILVLFTDILVCWAWCQVESYHSKSLATGYSVKLNIWRLYWAALCLLKSRNRRLTLARIANIITWTKKYSLTYLSKLVDMRPTYLLTLTSFTPPWSMQKCSMLNPIFLSKLIKGFSKQTGTHGLAIDEIISPFVVNLNLSQILRECFVSL